MRKGNYIGITNGCGYCIASHTAAARQKGMSETLLGELLDIIALANTTNRLANGYQVPIDEQFKVQTLSGHYL